MIRAIDFVSPRLIAKRLLGGYFRFDEMGALEKRCAKCREYWPADDEFFFSGVGYIDRLHCYCKACYIEKRWPNGRPSLKQTSIP